MPIVDPLSELIPIVNPLFELIALALQAMSRVVHIRSHHAPRDAPPHSSFGECWRRMSTKPKTNQATQTPTQRRRRELDHPTVPETLPLRPRVAQRRQIRPPSRRRIAQRPAQ